MAEPNAYALPDTTGHWVIRYSPEAWRPYLQLARIDRPIGWQLLLLPCLWGAALAGVAAHRAPDLLQILLFAVGSIAMRGAGSTFNDIVDRDIDLQVERTRNRPIPSGRVTRKQAAVFLVVQLLIGLAVLLCFNHFTIALACASLVIVALYPFAKRVSSWPQAVLGLAFAWGALVAWAAVFGSLAWAPILLYAAAIFWTIGYDTIYALQDRTDDAVVGIGSTALFFGDKVRFGVEALYAVALALAVGAVTLAGGGVWAWLGVAAFGCHLAWQVFRIAPESTTRSLDLFRANRYAGLMLFAGLAVQALSARL
ncbi:4-hydroxybenzoate octaprenyltransferase [Lichenihabitans sp. PAMC28606]|uniref:4-hydroxybenzoate octaprenyltransferase n=1 Tax=Lichenihabitans sp. PAMC28606 TaxID=2880932 RepID=UPI001D0AD547|nr:4-hydroxybenzoate octaprenyltransferase [Lichenihabitans sp. PAMC28606]UDL93491.1 4-hydroxybenzoate octaprenyltransferase [Lichenihabitans sp. PAMC28606]